MTSMVTVQLQEIKEPYLIDDIKLEELLTRLLL